MTHIWDAAKGHVMGDVRLESKQFLYAKVTPPIYFMIVGDSLFFRYAVATIKPLLK